MKRVLVLLSALVLVAGAGATASATPINASATGLTSPLLTITFDEHVLATGAVVTTQYSDLGVTFSPNLFYSPQTGLPNISGNDVGNFNENGGGPINPFSINFLTPHSAAAFAFVSNSTPYTFVALLGSIPIESFSAVVGNASSSDFYGFEGITFDQIQVVGTQDYSLIDNLQLGAGASAPPVPEPASLLLLGTGLAGSFLRRRRQRDSNR
jgi:hypothetical protein